MSRARAVLVACAVSTVLSIAPAASSEAATPCPLAGDAAVAVAGADLTRMTPDAAFQWATSGC